MSVSAQLQLKVLIFKEGTAWVAQVLERDMAAHGPTPYAALAAVQQVLQAHVNFDTRHQRQPLSRLSPAPDVFWNAFRNAKPLPIPPEMAMPPAVIEAAIANEPIAARPC